MTEVIFHSNVPDKLGYACRLLRKAWASGARVVVTAPGDLLRRLDTQLWTFSPLEFVPHCGSASPARVLRATPVVLAASLGAAPHQDVLVNLGEQVPEGFERFARLIEVVDQHESDRLAGRQRWRHYAGLGYAIENHDQRSA